MEKQHSLYTFGILMVCSTCATLFFIIKLIFNLFDIYTLYAALSFLGISVLLLGVTYYLKIDVKKQEDFDRKFIHQEFIVKIPLLILTFVLTIAFAVLYFFFFAFIAVSSYGKGGVGANASIVLLLTLTFIGWLIVAGFSFQKVLNTDSRDISLTIYNQFSILKWTALCVLPIGIGSCHYFYHDQGGTAFVTAIFWDLVLIGVYKGCSLLASKVQNHITEANVNRILHEKKKALVERDKKLNL